MSPGTEGSVAFPDARLEFESDNLVILDISFLLRKSKKDRYPMRDPASIDRWIYHHAGGRIKPLPQAIHDEATHFVRPVWFLPWPGKGWAGFGYHLWVPYQPETWWKDYPWGAGRWVVYMTQRPEVVSNHTKTQNATGASTVFQGSFNRKRRPSDAQLEIAERLWDEYIQPTYGLPDTALYCHNHFTKPSCPGPQISSIVETIRFRSA